MFTTRRRDHLQQRVTYWTMNSASILATTTSSLSSTAPNTALTTVAPLSSSSSTSQPGASSATLSAGAGAGTGIGCATVVVGILPSILLWRRERKMNQKLKETIEQETVPATSPFVYHELPARKTAYAQELGDTPRGESRDQRSTKPHIEDLGTSSVYLRQRGSLGAPQYSQDLPIAARAFSNQCHCGRLAPLHTSHRQLQRTCMRDR